MQMNTLKIWCDIKYSSLRERIRPKGYNLMGNAGFIINKDIPQGTATTLYGCLVIIKLQ